MTISDHKDPQRVTSPDDPRVVRARVALDGLSLGDAFGEKFFVSPDVVDGLIADRAVPAEPWYWTDDTAMALSVVEVLERHGEIDRDALAQAFAGRYAQDPRRGYGGTAHDILRRIAIGESWSVVAPSVFSGTGSMGNGGAMRVAPLGAFFAGDMPRVVIEARKSAEVTHAHPEGKAGAIAAAVAAAWACEQRDVSEPDPESLFATVLAHTPDSNTRGGIARASRLPLDVDVRTAVSVLGSGSRIIAEDTVPFSIWCAAGHMKDYVEALWATVAGLGDRDTTCAIVGGIVACATGPEQIPAGWLAAREPLPRTPA